MRTSPRGVSSWTGSQAESVQGGHVTLPISGIRPSIPGGNFELSDDLIKRKKTICAISHEPLQAEVYLLLAVLQNTKSWNITTTQNIQSPAIMRLPLSLRAALSRHKPLTGFTCLLLLLLLANPTAGKPDSPQRSASTRVNLPSPRCASATRP